MSNNSKKSLRGKRLNQAIEAELQEMISEGYESSPITQKEVHLRIKNKGIVKCGQSVLSTNHRNQLIEHYRKIQIQMSDMPPEAKAIASSNRTSDSQRKIITKKNEEIRELQEKIEMSYAILVKIIQAVESSGSRVDIEKILSEFLLDDFWDAGIPPLKEA